MDKAWAAAPQEPTQPSKEDTMAARTRKAKNVEPATVAEVRAYFVENPDKLEDGLVIGQRGRISADVKDAFTKATGRPVA